MAAISVWFHFMKCKIALLQASEMKWSNQIGRILFGTEIMCQKINLYFHLVSFCVSDDVVFYSVKLNLCQRLCIYILSYLYSVTLYSLLMLRNDYCFYLSFFYLSFFSACLKNYYFETLLLFSQSRTKPYT